MTGRPKTHLSVSEREAMTEKFVGYIFDLDGTLLDSMQLWLDIDRAFLRELGFEADDDYSHAVKSMGYEAAAQYTVDRYLLDLSAEEVMRRWQEMSFIAYDRHVDLKPGALDYLHTLKTQGKRLGIATALNQTHIEAALNRHAIKHLFDTITMLSEVHRGKGHPDIYLLAAQRLGIHPSHCIVFEDILSGIKGAKKGGFTVCGVFDASSEKDWTEIGAYADLTIRHWDELRTIRSDEADAR